jgi:hypothetical protein
MTSWISTLSREHVLRAVAAGHIEADLDKPHPLRRLHRDDRIAFYSPKTDHPDGAPLQSFTALGRVLDDEPVLVEAGPDVRVWRRGIAFLDGAETPIRPLLDHLGFIVDKKRWGFRFRFGLFRIPDEDFAVIRQAMTVVSER